MRFGRSAGRISEPPDAISGRLGSSTAVAPPAPPRRRELTRGASLCHIVWRSPRCGVPPALLPAPYTPAEKEIPDDRTPRA